MSTITKQSNQGGSQYQIVKRGVLHTTLLDLLWAVSDVERDDKIVAATVADLVNSGRARLTGTFKGAHLIIT